MKDNKSSKQLRLQREKNRNKKKLEFEQQYPSVKKLYEEKGFDSMFPFDTLEEFIERELEKWEIQQPQLPLIISGKYNDQEKIVTTYQQRFVDFIGEFCPDVIKELKELLPCFDMFWGETINGYSSLFEWHQLDNLFDLDNSLDLFINSLLISSNNTFYPLLQFRPKKHKTYRHDYKWGEYRVLLNFLSWLFPSVENKTEFSEFIEKREETLELLENNLVWDRDHPIFPKHFEESILKKLIRSESKRIFDEIITNLESLFSDSKWQFTNFLEGIHPHSSTHPHVFIELMIGLLKWAEQHYLEKDWLLRYAFYFLSEFRENPNQSLVKITVPALSISSFDVVPFEFNFEGWNPGEEVEDYEARLKKRLEPALNEYYQMVGISNNLGEIKKGTKPPGFDRVKWLVWWNFNLKSKDEILNEIYNERLERGKEDVSPDPTTIDKAFGQFKTYSLPVKQ